MKITEYMKMVKNAENGEYVPGEAFEDLIEEYEDMGLDNGGPFILTRQQQETMDEWASMLDEDYLSETPFADKTFLAEFMKSVPEEEQFKYVENTNNYRSSDKENCDPNYVIVTRRAVPSEEAKPEQFWSTEHREILMGLSNEIPKGSPQRHHSAIMVSTLQNLEEHGHAITNGGSSDGEKVTSSKPFTEDEMLFVYKPMDEIHSFVSYARNGEVKNEDILATLKENAMARAEKTGLTDIDMEENTEDLESDEIETDIEPDGFEGPEVGMSQTQVTYTHEDEQIGRSADSISNSFKDTLETPVRPVEQKSNSFIDSLENAKNRQVDANFSSFNKSLENTKTKLNNPLSNSFLKSLGSKREECQTGKSDVEDEMKAVANEQTLNKYKSLSFKSKLGTLSQEEQLRMAQLQHEQVVQNYIFQREQRMNTNPIKMSQGIDMGR